RQRSTWCEPRRLRHQLQAPGDDRMGVASGSELNPRAGRVKAQTAQPAPAGAPAEVELITAGVEPVRRPMPRLVSVFGAAFASAWNSRTLWVLWAAAVMARRRA